MNTASPATKRTQIKWLLIWAVWTFIILFYTTQIVTRSQAAGQPISFLRGASWQFFSGYLLFAFFPLILWLGRRFPFERGRWKTSILVHIIAGSLITVAHQAVDALVLPHLGYPPNRQFGSYLETYRFFLLFNFHLNASVYCVVVGAQYGLRYYEMYRERELRATQLEARLAQSRLQMLKMQLHPHFLFNTLNTISELVHKDPEAAEHMITTLGELLRLSLESVGVQEVPLHQELAFLKKYLDIEQTRFHDRLRVEINIDPEALDAAVPNMILQPLVENAIRHGIAPLASGGCVSVGASRDNGALQLLISDDGCGPPRGDAGSLKEGVGLSNTRARLQHLYGPSCAFQLKGAPNTGMTVSLTIPYRPVPPDPGEER
ncbi:MAG TPA: histidine kinase [Blastocatellia bacterium]|nr:histidine kinase [Blastocatellia bacterium]